MSRNLSIEQCHSRKGASDVSRDTSMPHYFPIIKDVFFVPEGQKESSPALQCWEFEWPTPTPIFFFFFVPEARKESSP
jgi:hypothetical protein